MMNMELVDTFTRETSVQEREDSRAGRHGSETESGEAEDGSEEQFFAQLGRGASTLMLRSSAGSTTSLVEPFVIRDDYDGVARREKGDDGKDHDDGDGDEDEEDEETAVEYGKAKEAVAGDYDDEKLIAEQMRRDEAMARQLQIQFLREEAGIVDDELLRQLNGLVQSDVALPLAPADDAELIECAICCDEKKPSEIYTYYQCGHRYCTDCLREYYATHINEGDVKLHCPYPNCSTTVLPVQITAVVQDPTLLRKYNQFAWFDQVKSNPNTRWCTQPGCETVLTRQDDSVDQQVMCSGCHTVTCFLCGDEWHEDISCRENRDRKVKLGLVDTSVEDYAKKNIDDVRVCPRCAVPIEKNKGCNTMTCSFCGCAFCWLCGQVMTPNHFSQKGPCKGKDGEAKWLKATVYTIIAVMVLTLPLWAGPAFVVHKVKQHRRRRARQLARAEMPPALADTSQALPGLPDA